MLTWPVPLALSDAALGSANADGMKLLWTLWWMRASIWDYGVFPFDTGLINYPVGMDLSHRASKWSDFSVAAGVEFGGIIRVLAILI